MAGRVWGHTQHGGSVAESHAAWRVGCGVTHSMVGQWWGHTQFGGSLLQAVRQANTY